jgi:hypothetical protein
MRLPDSSAVGLDIQTNVISSLKKIFDSEKSGYQYRSSRHSCKRITHSFSIENCVTLKRAVVRVVTLTDILPDFPSVL